jgi:hypothetical protein
VIDAEVDPKVYVTAHCRDVGLPVPGSGQVGALKVPSAPASSKETVPWGADLLPVASVSVTVAVHVELAPEVTEAGEHATEVVVTRRRVSVPLPETLPPVSLPPAPTEKVVVPTGVVEAFVVMVSVEVAGDPFPLKPVGENDPMAPVGRPETLNVPEQLPLDFASVIA